jgi:hypothetical protein
LKRAPIAMKRVDSINEAQTDTVHPGGVETLRWHADGLELELVLVSGFRRVVVVFQKCKPAQGSTRA